MSSRETLNILDALDNLTTLVETESLENLEITENSHIIAHPRVEKKKGKEKYWVSARTDEQTVDAIKETFRVVFHYLKEFYSRMQKSGDTQRLVEGINTIMVLVGEATKKLDRFSHLFQEKITGLREYKELQNFYRNKVIKESYQEFSRRPISHEEQKEVDFFKILTGEPIEEIGERIEPISILDDLETVRKDTNYELFYLRNEEGKKFYTNELARNIKLACDFGKYTQEYFGDDPLLQIKNWEDKHTQLLAKKLLDQNKLMIESYFKEAMSLKGMEIIAQLNLALMALMLSANPRNLIRQFAIKGCHRYFSDFQHFMRDILSSRDYQKFLVYGVPSTKPFFNIVLDLIQALCFGLYTLEIGQNEVTSALKELIQRENPKAFESRKFSDFLKNCYLAFQDSLKKHPNGPIFKVVDIIREEGEQAFDPILENNLPQPQWNLKVDGKDCLIIHMPSPTRQEFIHYAEINEEFKGFLRSYLHKEEGYKHLIFNFQDRTSWREHARSLAIEDLQRNAEFANTLYVITLSKDTDFYHQKADYEDLDNAKDFIDQFYSHLMDESTGYFFTPYIKKMLFPSFVKELMGTVHTDFFDRKASLNTVERQNFIELVYLGIQFKLLKELQPNSLSFVSKDGLDVGCCETISFISFIKNAEKQKWNENEKEQAIAHLFGPTFMARERPIFQERFNRMQQLIKWIEDHQVEKAKDLISSISIQT